jgi:hypothetical protein
LSLSEHQKAARKAECVTLSNKLLRQLSIEHDGWQVIITLMSHGSTFRQIMSIHGRRTVVFIRGREEFGKQV